MNNNINNNEQDMILKQKIEKREKFDTILAYILLVILLGAIVIVLWLKFIRKEEKPTPDEYVPNYISLSEISTSFNSSSLVNRYMNDNATLSSNVVANSLVISYTKDETNFNVDIPMVGNELMISVPDEYSEVLTEIYKEIANIICMYYDNEEKYCRNTLNNMSEEGLDTIRIDNSGISTTVYITTTKSFNVNNKLVYNDVTIADINDTDYNLNLLDTEISNINVTSGDTNIVFSGNIRRLTEDTSDFSIVIKLYDNNNNVYGENKQEFNSDNQLPDNGNFEISFILSDDLKLENIKNYSVEIVK